MRKRYLFSYQKYHKNGGVLGLYSCLLNTELKLQRISSLGKTISMNLINQPLHLKQNANQHTIYMVVTSPDSN